MKLNGSVLPRAAALGRLRSRVREVRLVEWQTLPRLGLGVLGGSWWLHSSYQVLRCSCFLFSPQKSGLVVDLLSQSLSHPSGQLASHTPEPEKFSSEEPRRPERVKGAKGRQEVRFFFPSENPFCYLQSLLFHARQRGAGHVLGPHRPRQAALLQHKVIVGSGVHGVENVGVVRDSQLCRHRRDKEAATCYQSK